MSKPEDDDLLALQHASMQILRRRRFIHIDPAVSSRELILGGLAGAILNAVWGITVPGDAKAWLIVVPLVLMSLGLAVIGFLEVRSSRSLEQRVYARDKPDRSHNHETT